MLEPVSAKYVSEELRVRVLNALWNISLQDVDDTCNGKQPIIKAGTVPLIVASVAAALGKTTEVAAQLRRYGAGTLLSGIYPRVFWISLGGAFFFGAYEAACKAMR